MERISLKSQFILVSDYYDEERLKKAEKKGERVPDIDRFASAECMEGQTHKIIAGGGFCSAAVYTGALGKNRCMHNGNVIAYRVNTQRMIWFCVYVNNTDEYVLDVIEISEVTEDSALSFGYFEVNRGKHFIPELLKTTTCYVDVLKSVFEGEYDKFCNQYQDGFIYVS